MLFSENELIVTGITVAIFIPVGTGAPVHKDRTKHGLAFNLGCDSVYHFSTGKSLTCHAGQCIYLPQGSTYTVEHQLPSEPLIPDAGTYAINFFLADPAPAAEPVVLSVRGKDKALSFFSKAEIAWRQKSPGYYEDCLINLYQLFKLLRQESATYSSQERILNKLTPALQHIEANYTNETISLPYLAELCGMSEPHLRKLFRAAFSTTPSNYIRNMRINYAKDLLHSGEYSVAAAASLSGFNDLSYFSREFKKATGISPNKYRP